MLEIEAKIRVQRLDDVRARLAAAGALLRGRYLEHNVILDRPEGDLRRAGRGLRVRSLQTLQGEAREATLTFKGPVQPGAFKKREELELELGDAEAMVDLFVRLGFEIVVSYRKRRESWRLDDCAVELDEVPLLGSFVEIEGASEAAVAGARSRLGLEAEPHVAQSYVTMLSEACRAMGVRAVDVGFDP